jgi:subtilisin family serine protease
MSSMINEINHYPAIQDSKNEPASQANKSTNFTISSTVSFAEELIGERSYETVPLKDEKAITVEAANKKINIEPILKKILESDYRPPSAIIRIAGREEQYKVPPGVNGTILVKIYVSNKSTENLFSEFKALGAEPSKYYQNEKLIKARVPINNITKVALLPEVIDVRRVINFPLTTQDYNIRFENNEQYYHVFLDVENHTSNATIIQTLENLGVKIKKQYNDGITDFRAYVPVRNLTKVAELPFVTHIEYHDIPVKTELFVSKKMIGVDYVRNNINPNLNGSGVRLAVIDTGIDHHHPYLPRPVYELDVRDNAPDGNYSEDESGHGTHVIGIITNNYSAPSGYEGVSPDVELAVLKATGEPGLLGDINQQIHDAIDHAVNDANAQVISMSLGITNASGYFVVNSDGTDKWEQKADWAARNGAIFVKSAGNEGNYYNITSPGTAKNVIAVGAINHWYHEETNVTAKNTWKGENLDEVTNYSSRGDTGDNGYEHGRDKPEVVAPGGTLNLDCTDSYGDGVVSARGKTDNQSFYLPLVNWSCSYKNNNLYRMVGTSMAAPHVSGTAALIIDNYNFTKSDRNAAIVKAMIVGSGINIGDNDLIADHADNHVDDDIGYGKVDLYQAIGYNGSTRKNWYFGDSLNSSGAIVNYTFTVPGDQTYHYIKATVVWNDPPTTDTDPNWGALKNDIDIELKDPSGTLIDSSNSWQQNIEQINYYNPSGIASGNWTLQVIARNHWDSAQEFGGFINLYTDQPSVNIRAFSNKSNVSAGDKIQITATVNNTGGEVASGVIVSLNLTSPPGSSIYDNFTIDSGYEKTLLGNIPPLGSRTVSWNLTVKNAIPETTFSIKATYSNTGSATNSTVTLNGNSISGWDYRKQRTITGTTAGAQTNYQMKLTLYNTTGTGRAMSISEAMSGVISAI